MTTGEKIKAKREEKGISQRQLADALGVSKSMVSQYENGKRNPKTETLEKIANALQVDITEIDGREKQVMSYILLDSGIVVDREPKPVFSDSRHAQIMNEINKLDDDGQDRVLEYIKFIASNAKYRKKNNSK